MAKRRKRARSRAASSTSGRRLPTSGDSLDARLSGADRRRRRAGDKGSHRHGPVQEGRVRRQGAGAGRPGGVRASASRCCQAGRRSRPFSSSMRRSTAAASCVRTAAMATRISCGRWPATNRSISFGSSGSSRDSLVGLSCFSPARALCGAGVGASRTMHCLRPAGGRRGGRRASGRREPGGHRPGAALLRRLSRQGVGVPEPGAKVREQPWRPAGGRHLDVVGLDHHRGEGPGGQGAVGGRGIRRTDPIDPGPDRHDPRQPRGPAVCPGVARHLSVLRRCQHQRLLRRAGRS